MRPLERFPSRDLPADDIRQRLRELPTERQPPYDWAEFRRRARERSWPRRSAVKWEHAAAAAGVTVLIASMAMWGRSEHQHADVAPSGIGTAPPVVASSTPEHSSPPVANNATTRPWTPEQMTQLNEQFNADARARAEALSRATQAAISAQVAALATAPASRRWLAQQPAEPAVVRVGSRLAVANLEDRIAWVDDALSDAQFAHADAPGLRALRQERARLVGSLAQVRYAETLAAQVP
jgi:hypothetical protein